MQRADLLALQRLQDPPLRVDGEALVEPEVLGGGIGNEISGPGVRQLVRYHIDQRAISGQHRGGDEREPRILHPAVWKRERHGEDIEALPEIGAKMYLRGADRLLHVRKLPR